MIKKLSELNAGERAVLKEIRLSGLPRRRLLDFGFVKNSEITLAHRSPLGDPTAYWIKGTMIALREEETRHIDVEIIEGEKGIV